MSDNNQKYTLRLSMNVLNHLGLNLYSNNAAVISEVVANAWDADATEVRIESSKVKGKFVVTITDNGLGMDYDDVCNRYLYVGYERREEKGKATTPTGRKVMGRKGIGKLSLFSIASKISVYTKKKDHAGEAFEIDVNDIKKFIKTGSKRRDESEKCPVQELKFNNEIDKGTLIKITDFDRRFTEATYKGLRKRIARRFSIIGGDNFKVFLDGKKITYKDRGYFNKARFLFQYNTDFSKSFKGLETDGDGQKIIFPRGFRFNKDGNPDKKGEYAVNGWIAVAKSVSDLDEGKSKDDNLNNITLVVRGKVAQEDLLHEHRVGGMITKYIYGEIEADFLDDNDKDDIATSSRQRIIEDDPRYQALAKFMRKELGFIWKETDRLAADKGLSEAMDISPSIKQWYEKLKYESLEKEARRIFGIIGKVSIRQSLKKELYAQGVLAFEKQRMKNSLKELSEIKEDNVQQLLQFFQDVDEIEGLHYYEIVQERLSVIERLQEKTLDEVVLEKELRDYLFDHLWLFDPAWERPTENKKMEKTMQRIVDGVSKRVRPDIRYRKAQREHVIIELKRPSRSSLAKTDIESQLRRYIDAVEQQLNIENDRILPINGICIVGKLPTGWDDDDTRLKDEQSLALYRIRVMTYDELIKDAYYAYQKYLRGQTKGEELRELIDKIKRGE